MANKTRKKSWARRLIIAVVVAEASYLFVFNLALQLPLTQSFVNQIRPEKFNIAWESAWTLYPFRFHISNAAGNGQSRSQQWEFNVKSVSASIDVIPLIFKRVWIDNVKVTDATYFQRPRLKPDRDYSERMAFFPPISGRVVTNVATTPKKNKKPWHVDIEGIRLDGQFDYWIQHFKGRATGTVEADLDVISRGGVFSLRAPEIDLALDPHQISESEIFRRGRIKGELEFTPFVPRENRGVRALRYLLLDTDLDIQVNSLAFIDLFTRNFEDLKTDGAGGVSGHIHMQNGRLLERTGLSVDADNLRIEFLSHVIRGNGSVVIEAGPKAENRVDMNVRFNDLVMHHGGGEPLFSGLGLQLNYMTTDNLLPVEGAIDGGNQKSFNALDKPFELQMKIPAGHVADMSVFNYYFPPSSPFKFGRGMADLQADILLKPDDADGFLNLKAKGMQAVIDNQAIQADFSANLLLVDGMPADRMFDISGSELKFDDVKVTGENESFEQAFWATQIVFRRADLVFAKPMALQTEVDISMTDSRPIVAMLGNQKERPKWIKDMLTIEDVKGVVYLDMAGGRILIPDAFINSEKIGFGAKAIIDTRMNDGLIYARYKKLDLVVNFSAGKRKIDLMRAREKFDAYRLPAVPE